MHQAETDYYLNEFQTCVKRLDSNAFRHAHLDLKVGIWMDSVCLKIQNQSWTNQLISTKPFCESVFFSIWVDNKSIYNKRLYYNIHALKLRYLNGYAIKSREFADSFRLKFQIFKDDWPNVNLNFGPLTLMQGHVQFDSDSFEPIVLELADKFLEMHPIIDELLAEMKK